MCSRKHSNFIAQKYWQLHHCVDNKILSKTMPLCKTDWFLHIKYDKPLYSDGELTKSIMQHMTNSMNAVNFHELLVSSVVS